MTAAMPMTPEPDLLPDDILSAIFTLAEEESGQERLRFRSHDFDLQRVFNDLAKRFSIIRRYFVFSSTGPLPYSPALTESVSRLQLAGLIGRENPDFEFLFLRPAARDYFEKDLRNRFQPQDLNELREVARVFAGSLNK